MAVIVAGMAVTYLADLIIGPIVGIYLSQLFDFNRALILKDVIHEGVQINIPVTRGCVLIIKHGILHH